MNGMCSGSLSNKAYFSLGQCSSNPEKAVDLDDFDEDDTLTYLVDKSDGDNKVFGKWKITSYDGGWWESSSSVKVADFIMHIATSCVAKVYVEGY